MKKRQDVYMQPEILYLDNCIVRVLRPIHTDEECECRMERIKNAAAKLIISTTK